jgi:uncharacterized protein YjbI with pentapeptide repeats
MVNFTAKNLRYDPFAQTYSPYGYGYSGNDKEVKTIPTSSPYWIYLDEIPREDSPSTLFINEFGGSNFSEVSFSTSPASGQFRVVYGGDGTTTIATAGQGIVEFNSADAGKIVQIKYYGLGNISDNQFFGSIFDGKYGVPNTTKLAYQSFVAQQGNDLNIAGTGFPSITALSETRIALTDHGNDDLSTYDFDGVDWTKTGNSLALGAITGVSITALSSSRIAYIDIDNLDLRVYDFDGTDWSQTGNDLNITGVTDPSITALSSTRIAFIDDGNDDLRTYDFDGTDWSQTGNDLNISGVVYPAIAALSSRRIAFIDEFNIDLRTYEFDGTDWAQVGSDLVLSGIVKYPYITALSDNRIAFITESDRNLRVYDFDGSNWAQTGYPLSLSGAGGDLHPAITALTSSRIAYIDSENEDLRTYYAVREYTPPGITLIS